jgi:hypothetical protein
MLAARRGEEERVRRESPDGDWSEAKAFELRSNSMHTRQF